MGRVGTPWVVGVVVAGRRGPGVLRIFVEGNSIAGGVDQPVRFQASVMGVAVALAPA
jgi:hypothetical protein